MTGMIAERDGRAVFGANSGLEPSGIHPMQLLVEANGAVIPAIGLGTWELRGRACSRLVEQALRLGYRHIDTAQVYENERDVGDGLRASGVKRDDVFVTTKVWTTRSPTIWSARPRRASAS